MSASSNYAEFMASKQELQDLKAARTRCWGAWLKCLGLGAFGSIWQSVASDNWKPTIIATVVAVPCLGLSVVDFGATLMFAPPITSAAMFTAKAKSARNRFRIVSPMQADAMLIDKGIY